MSRKIREVLKIGDVVECSFKKHFVPGTGRVTKIEPNQSDSRQSLVTMEWNDGTTKEMPRRHLRKCLLPAGAEVPAQSRPNVVSTTNTNSENAINNDAIDFQTAIENTMILHSCACCGREFGLLNLIPLSSCEERIAASPLKSMWESMVSKRLDPSVPSFERNYAQAAFDEMKDGLLKYARHICVECTKDLPKISHASRRRLTQLQFLEECEEGSESGSDGCDNDEANIQEVEVPEKQNIRRKRTVPKYALVNGYFRGECPEVIKKLNRTELSMISLVNVVTKICMLPKHTHYSSCGTVFSIINNAGAIVDQIPRDPDEQDFAFIRTSNSRIPSEFQYTPKYIVDAIEWLAVNNENFVNIAKFSGIGDHWSSGGSTVARDIPFIEAMDEDYEGVEEITEGIGIAVNPGAPSSTDVLLASTNESSVDKVDLITSIIQTTRGGSRTKHVITRPSRSSFASIEDDNFMQKAFVHLYPYGRGGPQSRSGQMTDDIEYNESYIKYCLELGGDRSFQKCPTFIFFSYNWRMRQKSGIVAYLASRTEDTVVAQDNDFTVEDARQFLEDATSQSADKILTKSKMQSMLNRMLPFSSTLPGTELYFKSEQRKLLSTVNSPVTNSKGQWRYFFTQAQNDLYMPELYDNAVTSSNLGIGYGATLEDKRRLSNSLDMTQRSVMLRNHPCLSARLFCAQQDAYWKHIIHGRAKPLGVVCDEWMRTEFQLRGTPHSHSLINIMKDNIDENSVTSDLQEDRQLVLDEVRRVSSAILVRRASNDRSELVDLDPDEAKYVSEEIETSYDFKPKQGSYFLDRNNPCRQRFEAHGRDFSRDYTDGMFSDSSVQTEYRRKQIACQIHSCRPSCFKYCQETDVKICRYNYPRPYSEENEDECIITTTKDKANRVRISVQPPRNNANINPCAFSPLMFIAGNGNQDVQFIQNVEGGVQYVCKYASKAELPDMKALQNACCRKLSMRLIQLSDNGSLTLQTRYRSICNAFVESQQIGSVQACYILSRLPLVKSSRTVVNINSLRRKEFNSLPIIMDFETLETMDGTSSAVNTSAGTQFGRRIAYYELYKLQKQKYKSVSFSFYSFLSSFKLSNIKSDTGTSGNVKEGSSLPALDVDLDGFISNATTFKIGLVKYSAVKKLNVIQLTPYIAVNENDERSAYSILLLYSDWGDGGEEGLLEGYESAVEKLKYVKCTLPNYVIQSLERTRRSDELLSKTAGRPGRGDVQDDSTGTHSDSERIDDTYDEYANDSDNGQDPLELEESDTIIEAADVNFTNDVSKFYGNTSRGEMAYLRNYIQRQKDALLNQELSFNSFSDSDKDRKLNDATVIIPINNAEMREHELEQSISKFNEEQRKAYNIVVEHVSNVDANQMILFLTGEGGTGKSTVIHAATLKTQLLFGKQLGLHGAVLKTAPTGGAAYNIGGKTWHSALSKGMGDSSRTLSPLSSSQTDKLRRELMGLKLFILDELSLLSLKDLYDISRRLSAANGNPKPFGGIHVILAGDFYQMKSIGGVPIISNNKNLDTVSQLGYNVYQSVTHFVELIHNNRARASNGVSPLAHFCSNIRKGRAGPHILALINQRLVNKVAHAIDQAHPEAVWICSTHKEIADVNNEFAKKMTKEGARKVKLIAHHVPKAIGIPMPDEAKRFQLYGIQGDPKNTPTKPAPTSITLFPGTRVRLTSNICVPLGLYNGAMGTVYGFKYKGRGPSTDAEYFPSHPYARLDEDERELPIILVRMDGYDHPTDSSKSTFPFSCSTHISRLVPIVAVQGPASICKDYKRLMYPLVVAHARTCHSMQGYTAENGIVVRPSRKFFAGIYVAISRAKDISGVIVLEMLRESHFYDDYYDVVDAEYHRLRSLFNN